MWRYNTRWLWSRFRTRSYRKTPFDLVFCLLVWTIMTGLSLACHPIHWRDRSSKYRSKTCLLLQGPVEIPAWLLGASGTDLDRRMDFGIPCWVFWFWPCRIVLNGILSAFCNELEHAKEIKKKKRKNLKIKTHHLLYHPYPRKDTTRRCQETSDSRCPRHISTTHLLRAIGIARGFPVGTIASSPNPIRVALFSIKTNSWMILP